MTENEAEKLPVNLQASSVDAMRIQIKEVWKYFRQNRLYAVLIFILAIGFLLLCGADLIKIGRDIIKEIAENNTGTVINLITLVLVFALWLANIIHGWKQSLPKYISVRFYAIKEDGRKDYDNDYGCERYISLSDAGDIRSLALQVGRQNNQGKNLNLDSTCFSIEKSLYYDDVQGNGEIAFWYFAVEHGLGISSDKRTEQKDLAKPEENAEEIH